MKSVVTGGAGFIGSHLVDRLLDEGHAVRVVDNFSVGRRANLAHHRSSEQLTVIDCDINSNELPRHVEGADWVFHLAALADIVPSIKNPLAYYSANVTGTLNVVEAARAAGVSRFVYGASSSCYGIPEVYPTSEEAPIQPQYPYALTKYLGEQIVLHWAQIYGLPANSLRFFNDYGPRVRTSGTYGAVFGVFLAQKIAGLPFTVVGDGSQTRDFTYVTDVVDAMVTLARSSVIGEIMNVGSSRTYSVNRLVELLGGPVVYIPKRPGEPDCTFADIAKIRRVLGWEPRTSFEKGVEIMLQNIDYWRDAPVWTPAKIEDATTDWFTYLGRSSRRS